MTCCTRGEVRGAYSEGSRCAGALYGGRALSLTGEALMGVCDLCKPDAPTGDTTLSPGSVPGICTSTTYTRSSKMGNI